MAQTPLIKASGLTHTVVRRTANVSAWAESDTAAPSYGNSTYARRNVTVKVLRAHSQVSDLQQSASMTFTDSLENEINSATDGMRETFEFMELWGVSDLSTIGFTGDTYQFDGVYPWILTDGASSNVIDVDTTIALSNLDSALDATAFKYQNLQGGKWVFLASPGMISKIGSLQTLIRRNVTQVEFEGGFTMDTYRGVPIIPSGFVGPTSTSASVTGLSGAATGSGSVAAATYRYKVAAITLYGEQVASAAVAVVHGGASASTALSWTGTTGAKSYAIYRTNADESDDDDNYDLLDIVPALTYTNGVGALTASPTYSDTFTRTAKTTVHPTAAGEENIFLVYLEPTYGVSLAVLPPTIGDPLGGDPVKNLVRYVVLNENTDTYQFRLKSYCVLNVPNALTCAVIRRAAKA